VLSKRAFADLKEKMMFPKHLKDLLHMLLMILQSWAIDQDVIQKHQGSVWM